MKKIIIFLVCFLDTLTPKNSSINYVLSNYEQTENGIAYLFYPAKNPQRLLITFCGAVKNRYIMWSWFWKNKEDWDDTAYLFLKDDTFCWYLGTENHSLIDTYSSIITKHINSMRLTKNAVFTIGGSMGGYAAIFYATLLGLNGAIAINPQVRREVPFDDTVRNKADIGSRWVDLDSFILEAPYVPAVSLIYSYNQKDIYNAELLIKALVQKNSFVGIRRHQTEAHTGGANLSKEFVENEIAYFVAQEAIQATLKKINL